MATNTVAGRDDILPAGTRGKTREHAIDKTHDNSLVRHVETEPQKDSAKILAVGAAVPLGMAAVALATTLLSNQERVSIAAWVATAVVGSASVISAAAVSHRRIVSVDRGNQAEKSADHHSGTTRTKAD